MKRILSVFIASLLLLTLFGCQGQQSSKSKPTAAARKATVDSAVTDLDPYATENRYDIGDDMFEERDGVDYGTVRKDVEYYSTTAGDNKQCNVLLPAGYDESEK